MRNISRNSTTNKPSKSIRFSTQLATLVNKCQKVQIILTPESALLSNSKRQILYKR